LLEDRDGSEKMDSGCIIELQRRGGRFWGFTVWPKVTLFCYMTLYSSVYRVCFRGICCLYFQCRVGTNYMALHLRIPCFLHSCHQFYSCGCWMLHLWQQFLKLDLVETRHKGNLHVFQSHPLLRQKGVHYMSINIFNSLPTYVRDLVHDGKQFIGKLKEILINNSFYSVDEFWLYCREKYGS
jgi:hypothetical protein